MYLTKKAAVKGNPHQDGLVVRRATDEQRDRRGFVTQENSLVNGTVLVAAWWSGKQVSLQGGMMLQEGVASCNGDTIQDNSLWKAACWRTDRA